MSQEKYLQIDWEYSKDNKIRVLRVHGSEPVLYLPDRIEDGPLTEIGAYCFAKVPHLPKQYNRTFLIQSENELSGWQALSKKETDGSLQLGELSGSFLWELELPETVEKIGNLAFYDCTELKKLTIGQKMMQVGSDAFMNCRSLQQLALKAGVCKPSGLKQILAQISADIEVTFLNENQIEAVVFYPEYSENYDEIAPAHIFGRNIEGEGFRARQSFLDGKVDLVQYDTIFPKACAEETDQTLQRIVRNRLFYPVDLKETARKRYETYFLEHRNEIAGTLAQRKEMAQIRFFCEAQLLDEAALCEAISKAAETEWTRGAAELLNLKQELFAAKSRERYSFEDF